VTNITRNDGMILSVTPKNDMQSGRPIGLPRRLYCVETKLERKLWSGFYTSNGEFKLAKFTSPQSDGKTLAGVDIWDLRE
jgi:hypothetical protein